MVLLTKTAIFLQTIFRTRIQHRRSSTSSRRLPSYRRHLFQFGGRSTRIHDDIFRCIIGYITIAIVRVYVSQIWNTTQWIPCRKNSFECGPKFRIEYRIDNRIECRIRVAEPWEYLECLATDARFTKGRNNVNAKEWHPADKKHAHNDANRYGGFMVWNMVRWRMVEVANFELFLGPRTSYASVAILLFFGDFAGPCNSSYRFYVLLSVAVQSEIEGEIKRIK